MEKVVKGKVALRFNISKEANNAIEMYQAEKRMDGEKLTKEEVVDQVMCNLYKNKK